MAEAKIEQITGTSLSTNTGLDSKGIPDLAKNIAAGNKMIESLRKGSETYEAGSPGGIPPVVKLSPGADAATIAKPLADYLVENGYSLRGSTSEDLRYGTGGKLGKGIEVTMPGSDKAVYTFVVQADASPADILEKVKEYDSKRSLVTAPKATAIEPGEIAAPMTDKAKELYQRLSLQLQSSNVLTDPKHALDATGSTPALMYRPASAEHSKPALILREGGGKDKEGENLGGTAAAYTYTGTSADPKVQVEEMLKMLVTGIAPKGGEVAATTLGRSGENRDGFGATKFDPESLKKPLLDGTFEGTKGFSVTTVDPGATQADGKLQVAIKPQAARVKPTEVLITKEAVNDALDSVVGKLFTNGLGRSDVFPYVVPPAIAVSAVEGIIKPANYSTESSIGKLIHRAEQTSVTNFMDAAVELAKRAAEKPEERPVIANQELRKDLIQLSKDTLKIIGITELNIRPGFEKSIPLLGHLSADELKKVYNKETLVEMRQSVQQTLPEALKGLSELPSLMEKVKMMRPNQVEQLRAVYDMWADNGTVTSGKDVVRTFNELQKYARGEIKLDGTKGSGDLETAQRLERNLLKLTLINDILRDKL